MEYTQEQLDSLHKAKTRHHYAGRPEVSNRIGVMIESGQSYAEIWAYAQSDIEKMVKPEKPADVIPPPAFTGRGSGVANWRKFALTVSDIEEEIVLSMGRNDIITVLSDRGVIEIPDGVHILGLTNANSEEE